MRPIDTAATVPSARPIDTSDEYVPARMTDADPDALLMRPIDPTDSQPPARHIDNDITTLEHWDNTWNAKKVKYLLCIQTLRATC